jgi:hypothetical protein
MTHCKYGGICTQGSRCVENTTVSAPMGGGLIVNTMVSTSRDAGVVVSTTVSASKGTRFIANTLVSAPKHAGATVNTTLPTPKYAIICTGAAEDKLGRFVHIRSKDHNSLENTRFETFM